MAKSQDVGPKVDRDVPAVVKLGVQVLVLIIVGSLTFMAKLVYNGSVQISTLNTEVGYLKKGLSECKGELKEHESEDRDARSSIWRQMNRRRNDGYTE